MLIIGQHVGPSYTPHKTNMTTEKEATLTYTYYGPNSLVIFVLVKYSCRTAYFKSWV